MIDLERQGQKNSSAWQKANNIFQNSSLKVKGLDKAIKDLDSSLGMTNRNVGNYTSAFGKLGSIIPGLVASFGVVGGIQLFTSTVKSAFNMVKSFDSAMAELAGVLEIPKNNLTEMKNLFLELGGTTAFTATEVAKASTELARLGFTQEKIKSSIKDVLNGTIAFQANLPDVAELAAGTLNAFGKEADQTGEIMNILAASANKTAAGFQDFVIALPKVSAPAHALGISLEQTSGMLGLLRDNSIAAESAGTGLRNIFLTSAKKGLDYKTALNQIATSQDKLATATNLFGKENATQALILATNIDKIDEYTAAVSNQGDALQFLVDQQMGTIAGSIKLLESAWEGFILSIETGDGIMADVFKSIIDSVTSLIIGITDISKEAKKVFEIIGDLFESLGLNINDLNSKEFMPNVFVNLSLLIDSLKWFLELLNNVVRGVVENLKANEGFSKSISDIKRAFDSIINVFKSFFSLLKGTSTETGILNAIIKILSTNIKIVAGIAAFYANNLTIIIQKTSDLINQNKWLKIGFEILATSILSPVTSLKVLYETGKATVEGLYELVTITGPKIGQALKDAINPFKEADFSSILTDIKSFGKKVTNAGLEVIESEKEEIALNQKIKGIVDTITKGNQSIAKAAAAASIKAPEDTSKNKTNGTGTNTKDTKKNKKKESDENIRIMQEELEFYIQSNNLKNKSDAESLDILDNIQKRKQSILDYQRSHNLISETKYQTELIKLLEDSNKSQIDYLKKSVQEKVDLLTSQYDLKQIPVDKLIDAEKVASDERKNILKKELEQGILSRQEYETSILKETKSLNDKLKGLNDEEASRQFKTAELILKNFQVSNKSKFEEARILNNSLYNLEVERVKKELELQKNALQAKYSINEEELNNRLKLGERLKENEVNYLSEIQKLNQDTSIYIKDSYGNTIDGILKRLEETREGNSDKMPIIEQVLFGEGGSEAFQEFNSLIDELSQRIASFGDVEEGTDEYNRLQTLISLQNDYTNALESQRQKEIETALVRKASTLESLEDGKALIKQVIQMAVAEAVFNAIKKARIPFPADIAIAAAAGAATNSLLNSMLNSISFEKGTRNAPFTGMARVDERGPEIHADRQGNIKSMGEKGGPRFTHIEKGDKIFTASQSKRIKNALSKQNAYSHLNFDTQPLIIESNTSKIDYRRLGNEFISALEKQGNKKENKYYLNGSDGIIEIVERKGLRKIIKHGCEGDK